MGVDYSAELIVGYEVDIPEDTDTEEFLEALCKKTNTWYTYSGNCYSGKICYYIVSPLHPNTVERMQEALDNLPNIAKALEQEGVTFDPNPVIAAKGYIY